MLKSLVLVARRNDQQLCTLFLAGVRQHKKIMATPRDMSLCFAHGLPSDNRTHQRLCF